MRLTKKQRSNFTSGFTLIELLVVIGILTVLFSITIIAINPQRQLAQGDNAQRRSDVNTILNAVYHYSVDNNGSLPTGVTGGAQMLGSGAGCVDASCGSTSTPATCLDLTTDLVETYIVDIPYDPDLSASSTSGYAVYKTTTDRVTVLACDTELSATISVTR